MAGKTLNVSVTAAANLTTWVWKTWRSRLASDWRERDSALVSGWINALRSTGHPIWSTNFPTSDANRFLGCINVHVDPAKKSDRIRKLEKFVDLYCYWHLDHSKKYRSLRWYHILLSIFATMLKYEWRSLYRWWTIVWWYGYIATLLYLNWSYITDVDFRENPYPTTPLIKRLEIQYDPVIPNELETHYSFQHWHH